MGCKEHQVIRAKPGRIHKFGVGSSMHPLHANMVNHVAGEKQKGSDQSPHHAFFVEFFILTFDGYKPASQKYRTAGI
jgi:hypothetical protein